MYEYTEELKTLKKIQGTKTHLSTGQAVYDRQKEQGHFPLYCKNKEGDWLAPLALLLFFHRGVEKWKKAVSQARLTTA